MMTINVKAYANADDVLIAWQPDTWPNDWVGFQLERLKKACQIGIGTISARICAARNAKRSATSIRD
jgi:hypothetical protein